MKRKVKRPPRYVGRDKKRVKHLNDLNDFEKGIQDDADEENENEENSRLTETLYRFLKREVKNKD